MKPFQVMDLVRHARGEGRVVGVFQQEAGERRWVCWVGFGETPPCSRAVYADELTLVRKALP